MARPPKPGPIMIPSTAEIVMNWGLGAQPGEIQWRNVLHAKYTTVPAFGPGLADDLFDAFSVGFTSSGWQQLVHNVYALLSVWVKDLNSAYQPYYLSSGVELDGTGATAAAPESVAIVVTHQTAKAGAQWRGRSYLGGLDSIVLLDGKHHTVDAGNKAVAFMEAVRNAIGASNMQMAVAQRELLAGQDAHGNPLGPRSANSEPITSMRLVNNRLDTQRKRLGR